MNTVEAESRQLAERVRAGSGAGPDEVRRSVPRGAALQAEAAGKQAQARPESLPIEAGLKGRIIQATA